MADTQEKKVCPCCTKHTMRSEEERKKIEKELEVLNGYVNIDSLFYEVDKERGILSRIGALPVDGSITTELLYSIISDCELLMEVQNE